MSHEIDVYKIKFGKRETYPTSRTLTDNGVCVTLNIENIDQIFNVEKNHLNYNANETKLRFDGNGRDHRFDIQIYQNKLNIAPLCGGLDQGYFVYIHAPNEYPNGAGSHFHVPLDSKFTIQITPTIFEDDEGSIKNLPLIERECYVAEEKSLRYYKTYNRNNCELECSMNYTLKECQCAQFFMPHDNATTVCGTEHKECYRKASKSMSEELTKCNCYSTCKTINYGADTQYFLYNLESFHASYDALETNVSANKKSYVQYHINTIEIFFKESQYLPLKRVELTGWSDFLANCGGLMGLFAGVSIVTIVEILYFCVCRCGGEILIGGRRRS